MAGEELSTITKEDEEWMREFRKEKREADRKMDIYLQSDAWLQKNRAEAEKVGIAKGLTEGIYKGRAEGLTEGMIKGKREDKIEVAQNAIKMGMNVNDISKLTGLDAKTIKSLIH
jgi:predicted transposase/invertase (TIGR01784 family)